MQRCRRKYKSSKSKTGQHLHLVVDDDFLDRSAGSLCDVGIVLLDYLHSPVADPVAVLLEIIARTF